MARPLSNPPEIGTKFNKLTVSGQRHIVIKNNIKRAYVEVICDCGKSFSMLITNLVNNKIKSCGCLIGRSCSKNNLSRTREYRAWAGMIDRCYDVKYELYHRYGGRGITVCDRWRFSLENFIIDMGKCPVGKNSIDRINNDGNYEPGNCRWSNPKEQSNNRSSCRIFEINGVRKNLAQWAAHYGVGYKNTWNRLNNGLSIIEALTKPLDLKQSNNSKKKHK